MDISASSSHSRGNESESNLSVGSPDGLTAEPPSTIQNHNHNQQLLYNTGFSTNGKDKANETLMNMAKDFKIKSEVNFPSANLNYPSINYRNQFDTLSQFNNDFTTKSGFNAPNKLLFSTANAFTPVSSGQLSETLRAAAAVTRANRNDVQFRCNQCGKCFTHSCKLQTHQRYHNGEKPFKCTECGKSFTQRAGLMQHHRLHTGEKPFKCQDCGKCFTQLAGAVQHQRTHSGEKPFACTECGKAFSQRAGLIQHERLHTGEKPFNCLDCGKCFTQLAGLNQHMRTHSGEKPFSCHICNKSYTQHAGLMAHMKSHATEGMLSPTMVQRNGNQNGNGAQTPSLSSQSSEDLTDKETPPTDSFQAFNPLSNFSTSLPQQSPKSRNSDLPVPAHMPNVFPNMQLMHGASAINMFNPNPAHGFGNKIKLGSESASGLLSSYYERAGGGGGGIQAPVLSPTSRSSTPKKSKIDKPYKCNICSKAYTQFAGLMIHQASHQTTTETSLSTNINAAMENIFGIPLSVGESSSGAGAGVGAGVGASSMVFPPTPHNPLNMAKFSPPADKLPQNIISDASNSLSHSQAAVNAPNILMNNLQ